jgi:hypothetical protein
MLRRILIMLLTISYANKAYSDTVCYSLEDRKKIATALVELEKCIIDLDNKNQFLEKTTLSTNYNGIIFSFSAGLAVGLLVASRLK